jgi:hypothetical protein
MVTAGATDVLQGLAPGVEPGAVPGAGGGAISLRPAPFGLIHFPETAQASHMPTKATRQLFGAMTGKNKTQ